MTAAKDYLDKLVILHNNGSIKTVFDVAGIVTTQSFDLADCMESFANLRIQEELNELTTDSAKKAEEAFKDCQSVAKEVVSSPEPIKRPNEYEKGKGGILYGPMPTHSGYDPPGNPEVIAPLGKLKGIIAPDITSRPLIDGLKRSLDRYNDTLNDQKERDALLSEMEELCSRADYILAMYGRSMVDKWNKQKAESAKKTKPFSDLSRLKRTSDYDFFSPVFGNHIEPKKL